MAIQIRKSVEEEKKIQALDPEVLPPEGSVDASMNDQPKAQAPGMEDKFVMRSGNAMAWLMEHRRMVSLVVILVLAVAVCIIGMRNYKESSITTKSTETLSKAFVTLSAKTDAEANAFREEQERMIKSQGIAADTSIALTYSYKIPNNRVRYAALESHLDDAVEANKAEEIGKAANLMRAGAKSRLRDTKTVLDSYQLSKTSLQPDVVEFASLGEAEMLIGLAKYDGATTLLNKIANDHAHLTIYTKLQIAQIHELKGEIDQAIADYAELYNSNNIIVQEKAKLRLKYLTPDWRNYAQLKAPAPIAESEK